MKNFIKNHPFIAAAFAVFLFVFAAIEGQDKESAIWITGYGTAGSGYLYMNTPDPSTNPSGFKADLVGAARIRQATSGTVGSLLIASDSSQMAYGSGVLLKVKNKLLIANSDSAANVTGSWYFNNGHTNPAIGLVGRGNQAAAGSDTLLLTNAPNRAGTHGTVDKWIRIRFKATNGGADTIYAYPAVQVSP